MLHYLIHCYDDPKYASLGLEAANRYGKVASDSPHALHMSSHIYLDLGMWKEYVLSNEASWAASIRQIQKNKVGPGDHDIHALHTLQWLVYGYLQQGQPAKAVESLKAMAGIHAANPSPMAKWYFAMMRANYLVNAPNWAELSTSGEVKGMNTIDLKGIELTSPATSIFATGYTALRQKRYPDVQRAIGELGELIKSTEQATQRPAKQLDADHHHDSYFTGTYASSIKPAQIMRSQLEALLLLADGKADAALTRLQDAVGDEDKLVAGYGPPSPVKPSSELLAEVYLRRGLPQNAMRFFQMALLRYPNRTSSLTGLSEAARLAGDSETAAKADGLLRAAQTGSLDRSQSWKQLPCSNCDARN